MGTYPTRKAKFYIETDQRFAAKGYGFRGKGEGEWENQPKLEKRLGFTDTKVYPSPGSTTRWPDWAEQLHGAGFILIREWQDDTTSSDGQKIGRYVRYIALDRKELNNGQKEWLQNMSDIHIIFTPYSVIRV